LNKIKQSQCQFVGGREKMGLGTDRAAKVPMAEAASGKNFPQVNRVSIAVAGG
jgi:hypothetical protein